MTTFSIFNLPSSLEKSLKAMNYETPTDIQARAIPVCLSGKDLLASAQTGTGKTGAFAIPLIAKLIENPSHKALILTPTRELAEQIFQVVLQMIKGHREIGVALLIGGVPIFKQFSRLRNNPQIIVGTPGRIFDHITRGKNAAKHQAKLDVSDFNVLILDEADRMLDMGFGDQLEAIVREMPAERQTLMFSATFPKGIKQISQRYLREPERIDVGVKHQLNTNLTHESIFIEGKAKFAKLVEAIQNNEGTIIVFANTKRMCDQISERLYQDQGIQAIAMHGDLKQSQRTRVLTGFRNKHYRVLVATDVASRGLDIPHVEIVINYDLPMSPEDYIHRVGRTARAGAKGHALDLVSSLDKSKLAIIKRLLKGEEMDFIKQMNKKPARRSGQQHFSPNGGNKARFSSGENRRSSGSYGSNSRSDRPNGSRTRSEGSNDSNTRSDRPYGSNSRSDRSNDSNTRSNGSYATRSDRSYGSNSRSDRSNDSNTRSNGSYTTRSDRPNGSRTRSEGSNDSNTRSNGSYARSNGSYGSNSRSDRSNDSNTRSNGSYPRSNGSNDSNTRSKGGQFAQKPKHDQNHEQKYGAPKKPKRNPSPAAKKKTTGGRAPKSDFFADLL